MWYVQDSAIFCFYNLAGKGRVKVADTVDMESGLSTEAVSGDDGDNEDDDDDDDDAGDDEDDGADGADGDTCDAESSDGLAARRTGIEI